MARSGPVVLSELQQRRLEQLDIRRIAGVKKVERRRMKDLRKEVATKACNLTNQNS